MGMDEEISNTSNTMEKWAPDAEHFLLAVKLSSWIVKPNEYEDTGHFI